MDRLEARGGDVRGERRAAAQWYRAGISQDRIDARLTARRSRLAALGLATGAATASDSPESARPGW